MFGQRRKKRECMLQKGTLCETSRSEGLAASKATGPSGAFLIPVAEATTSNVTLVRSAAQTRILALCHSKVSWDRGSVPCREREAAASPQGCTTP